MKAFKTSFLFFIIISFSIINKIQAQQEIDSSYHYYNLLKKPTSDNDLAKAYSYFDNSKRKNIIKENITRAILDLRYIAVIQYKLGFVNESENSSIEALRFLDNLKGSDTLLESRVGIYNHLGMIYKQRKDFKKAIEYYNKVLVIAKDSSNINSVFNNRAIVYVEEKNYKFAIKEFLKVYNYNVQIGDKEKIARSLDNLGFTQSKIHDSMALSNLMNALKIREEIKHTNGIFTSYLHLGEYYKDRNENDKSLEFIGKAYAISDSTNNIKQKDAVLTLKMKMKDDKDFSEYFQIKDSISDFQRLSRDKYAALKYEKDTEIKRADLSQRKMERWIVFSIVLGLLFVLIYSFQKFKHKKEKQKKVLETESRISKRIHDELANDVYSSMVQLENNTASVAEIVDNLEEIYHKARDLSQETTTIRSNKEFVDDLKKSLASFNNDETNVIVKGLIPDIWIDISDEKKLIVQKVLKELLVNMRKHSSANLVSVIFTRKINSIKIGYIDNGIGTYKKEISKGVGLVNAENRIEAIGGNFIFDKSVKSGFKVTIEIPV